MFSLKRVEHLNKGISCSHKMVKLESVYASFKKHNFNKELLSEGRFKKVRFSVKKVIYKFEIFVCRECKQVICHPPEFEKKVHKTCKCNIFNKKAICCANGYEEQLKNKFILLNAPLIFHSAIQFYMLPTEEELTEKSYKLSLYSAFLVADHLQKCLQ